MSEETEGFEMVGRILKSSGTNLYLASTKNAPVIGSIAQLVNGTKIGTVRDVIGPVREPILVVSVEGPNRERLNPGTRIFLRPRPRHSSSKHRTYRRR